MFYICTFASDLNKTRLLLESADMHNSHIQILDITNWTGYIDKILAMKAFVNELQDEDIVCFIDAYDVLVMTNQEEILQKFLSTGCNVVMSTELNCYPIENQEKYDLIEYYLFEQEYKQGNWGTQYSKMPKTNYKYMNSGGIIGYGKAMKTLYKWKSEDDIRQIIELGGDQNYFTQYYLENALDENLNMQVDANEKKVYFEFSNYSTVVFFENPH